MIRRALAIVTVIVGTAIADPTPPEPQLRQAALAVHQAAQASGVPADFERAAAAYATYLAAYPKASEALQMHFFRGQILILKLHRWVEGGDEMMIVANSEPPGKLHEEAVLEAIDAYAAAPDDKKLDAASDRFGALFGASSPRTPGVMFKLARRRFDRKDYEDAAQRFAAIVERFPQDPGAGAAGDLWLQALQLEKSYDGIEAAARKLRGLPAYAKPEQQEQLEQLIRDSIRIRAEAFAEKRDPANARRAAALYERLADEYPKDDRVDEVLYNAGMMFDLAHDFARALPPLHRLGEVMPTSKLAPKALYHAARVEEMFEPARAAQTYIQVSDRYPTMKEAPDALYNAAVLFEALGDTTHAAAAFDRYVRNYGGHRSDVDMIAFAMGMIYERAGDDARAAAAYETYAKVAKFRHVAEAELRLAQVALRLGQRDRARKALDAIRPLDSSTLGTELPFTEAELAASDATAVKLTGTRAQIVTALHERVARIEKAHAAYVAVIDRGEPIWKVAAYDHYAHLIEELDREIAAANAPVSGLADDPVELYERAYTIAIDAKIISPATLDARARPVQLRPERHIPSSARHAARCAGSPGSIRLRSLRSRRGHSQIERRMRACGALHSCS